MSSEVVAEAEDTPDKDADIPLGLDEIKECNIVDMAKDKFKSRQLQRSLSRGGQEFVDLIYSKVQPHLIELVQDQHGNYLMQKVLEVVGNEHFVTVFDLLKGELMTLSKDAHGTRAVQKIVEQAIVRDRVEQLLEALPADRAEELARNVTGFHVVVKLIESLPTDKANALLQRLCGEPEQVLSLGKDQWGCCVLKKCVDRADGDMRQKIVDAIAQHSLDLVQDAFGNYVVQHLIINRPPGQSSVSRIVDSLKGHVFELSLQKYSSNVLEKCLSNSMDKDRNKIINEILNPPQNQKPSEAVRRLYFHQFGNYVFQQSLEVAKDPQFSLLIEHSKQIIQSLYIEHSKMNAQGGAKGAAEPPPAEGGNLPAEHTQRLAVKLMKRYPQLSEGLDMGMGMGMGLGMDGNWMPDYYDPMWMQGYGLDPFVYGYGYPGYDAFGGSFGSSYGAMPPMQSPSGKGAGGSKASQGRRGGPKADGKKGKQGGGHKGGKGANAAAADGGVETQTVGRIVGFWPNYSITYDEVPVETGGTSGGGGNRGARSKNKAKSKAAPKAKAEATDA